MIEFILYIIFLALGALTGIYVVAWILRKIAFRKTNPEKGILYSYLIAFLFYLVLLSLNGAVKQGIFYAIITVLCIWYEKRRLRKKRETENSPIKK